MNKTNINVIFIAIMLLSTSASAHTNFSGKAYDIDTQELIYTEHHTFSVGDQAKEMQSIYLTPTGDQIALRRVIYGQRHVNHYELTQSSTNYKEAITRQGDQITITVQQGEDQSSSKTQTINNVESIIIDAGFSDFIVRNWDLLLSGETLKLKFASASRMSAVGLQIRFKEGMQGNALFTMTASNPIIRMLLTPITIGYSDETKQLTYYKGISNIQKNNGDTYDVEIIYTADDV